MAAKRTNKPRTTGRPKGKPRTVAEIAADKKRTGRPVAVSDVAASKGITMRLTDEEHSQFKKDARRLKMGLSAYLRYCWQTAQEGREDAESFPHPDAAEKSRNRKTGKRG